jgi:hypothetical protein
LKSSKSDAELAKAQVRLAAADKFRAEVEARVRREAISAHLPAGLPAKTAELVMLGITSELGDFEVDVSSWKPKDEAKIAEALKGYDLAALMPAAPVGARKGPAVLPPQVTTTPSVQRPRGVLKPSRLDAGQQRSSLEDRIATSVAAKLQK